MNGALNTYERYLDRELERLIEDPRYKPRDQRELEGELQRLEYGDEPDNKRRPQDRERDRREWEELDRELHKNYNQDRGLEKPTTYRQYQTESCCGTGLSRRALTRQGLFVNIGMSRYFGVVDVEGYRFAQYAQVLEKCIDGESLNLAVYQFGYSRLSDAKRVCCLGLCPSFFFDDFLNFNHQVAADEKTLRFGV